MQLVSCIMPTTRARQQFIPLAIRYFLRQDYPHAELIIIDDGPGLQQELIPEIARLSYRHIPKQFSTLGAKRNYACSLARGPVIMHWDDDDWYAPDWISRQLRALEDADAGIGGLSSLRFFHPASRECWQYTYNYNNRPWVAGATMVYRKAVWEKYPFPDLQVGEDNEFVWRAGAKVIAHDYTDGFISILHGRNTSPKHTSDRQWKSMPATGVQRILGKDEEAYGFCRHDPR